MFQGRKGVHEPHEMTAWSLLIRRIPCMPRKTVSTPLATSRSLSHSVSMPRILVSIKRYLAFTFTKKRSNREHCIKHFQLSWENLAFSRNPDKRKPQSQYRIQELFWLVCLSTKPVSCQYDQWSIELKFKMSIVQINRNMFYWILKTTHCATKWRKIGQNYLHIK